MVSLIVVAFTAFSIVSFVSGPLSDGTPSVLRSEVYTLIAADHCKPALLATWHHVAIVARFVRNTSRSLLNRRDGDGKGPVLYTADGKFPKQGDKLSKTTIRSYLEWSVCSMSCCVVV